ITAQVDITQAKVSAEAKSVIIRTKVEAHISCLIGLLRQVHLGREEVTISSFTSIGRHKVTRIGNQGTSIDDLFHQLFGRMKCGSTRYLNDASAMEIIPAYLFIRLAGYDIPISPINIGLPARSQRTPIISRKRHGLLPLSITETCGNRLQQTCIQVLFNINSPCKSFPFRPLIVVHRGLPPIRSRILKVITVTSRITGEAGESFRIEISIGLPQPVPRLYQTQRGCITTGVILLHGMGS